MGSKRIGMAAKTMVLVLAAQMVTLMPMALIPEAFVQPHLGLKCVASTVQQPVVLSVTARVEHVVWIVCGGSGAWRSVG